MIGFQNFCVGITLLEHRAFSVDQHIDDFPAIANRPQFPNPGLLLLAGGRDLVGREQVAMIWSAHADELDSRAVLHAAKIFGDCLTFESSEIGFTVFFAGGAPRLSERKLR